MSERGSRGGGRGGRRERSDEPSALGQVHRAVACRLCRHRHRLNVMLCHSCLMNVENGRPRAIIS